MDEISYGYGQINECFLLERRLRLKFVYDHTIRMNTIYISHFSKALYSNGNIGSLNSYQKLIWRRNHIIKSKIILQHLLT